MVVAIAPAIAYLSLCPLRGYAGSRTNTSASLILTLDESLPTGVSDTATTFKVAPASDDVALPSLPSIGWMDLSQAVFGSARNLETWEREALDEFTWAELRS